MVNSSLLSIRRRTCSVKIGDLYLGSLYPIRIQSMTTTKTTDVVGTVDQIQQLVERGCEIVRVTVQGMQEVRACEKIKDALLQLNIVAPLVADIHFFPQAAMHVADFVDKVRINPGNFADRGQVSKETGLQQIEDKFSPLVEKCKRLNKAIRIGVNHGSLSKRILYQYGNSVEGMLVSALEYVSVCRRLDFHDVVISMKSSNTKTMVAAYRATAQALDQHGWLYPLHLGVTEAGMHLDSIVKSYIGIGTLLAEGIGDTIRCSLTGDPVQEIPACEQLLQFSRQYLSLPPKYTPKPDNKEHPPVLSSPFEVYLKLHDEDLEHSSQEEVLTSLGIDTQTQTKSPTTPDGVFLSNPEQYPALVQALQPYMRVYSYASLEQGTLPFSICHATFPATHATRHHALETTDTTPTLLVFSKPISHFDDAVTYLSVELGSVLMDGLGSAVLIDFPCIPIPQIRELIFSILLSASVRSVKTEYIACPSCGRTQFDITTVTEKIQASTSHLPGLKIAIMGCIVNGLGEMADADFGLVGTKVGMVDLYVQRQKVKADIPLEDAEQELIQLLKDQGVWKDPQ